jgi:Flp pilus assembly protein TadG
VSESELFRIRVVGIDRFRELGVRFWMKKAISRDLDAPESAQMKRFQTFDIWTGTMYAEEGFGSMSSSVTVCDSAAQHAPLIYRFLRFLKSRTEGSALVEMAVTIPLLMAIFTGLCFMGIAVDNYLILTHATDVGARYLAVGRGQLTDPCAQTITVIEQAAPGLSTSKLAFTFYIGPSSALGTSCNTTTDLGYMSAGATATVNIVYTYSFPIAFWKPVTIAMQSQTSEIVQ